MGLWIAYIALAVIALVPAVFRVIELVVSRIVTGVTLLGKFLEWVFPYLLLVGAFAFIAGISIALVAMQKRFKDKLEESWNKKFQEAENSWKEKLERTHDELRDKQNKIENLRRELLDTKHLLEKKTYEQGRTAQEAVNDSFKSFL